VQLGPVEESIMVNFGFGIILVLAQLVSLGGGLPQIMEPKYSEDAVESGSVGEVVVSFDVIEGYVINRMPPIQLKLQEVDGLTHNAANLVSPPDDPKSTDEYYVDVPTFSVKVSAVRTGEFEIPGELVYFFCSKADGFCSRQIIDVAVPVVAE
jgi:hypothetical protein